VAKTVVSCDVDSPFEFDAPWKQVIHRAGGDIIKRHSPKAAIRSIFGKWFSKRFDYHFDSHRSGIDLIMHINEKMDRSVAFYFIPECTDPTFDGNPKLYSPHIRKLFQAIHVRGHEIGIHPGYHTYRHPKNMAQSLKSLEEALENAGIVQPSIGGRQHFLRWETPTTACLWDAHGLNYDSTLSYAQRPGFRCGTCFEYPMFDAVEQRSLRLRERPLIVMECSVIADQYLGLGYSDAALEMMKHYQDTCYKVGGQFGLLWHNSHFSNETDVYFYKELVNK
jgi:peptidoglycan/xylan/chitin deacetylase (PgdA/CDA1 family)